MHRIFITRAGALACALALAGCAGMGGNIGTSGMQMPGKAPADAAVAATWYNPPSEFPGICLTQFKDGSLRFDGGFAFFNPGRWEYDAATSELRLQLAPTPSLELSHAQIVLHKNLLRVDGQKNTLVYGVKADTQAIGLGGFVFYRDTPCPARRG
ncbi:hypothetical protein IGS59_00800 [Janthinobacterium sp. GW460P]|uniref:hypothetical protein n=1 Tax=unclassified Janthinobacterium TaxID=2610881 RepID=UPI000A328050|nr:MULTISPECIES: hypothetical protein [unclassified Janthinobacterium]MCC7700759.1 hypothetical protein [Janthinobacterium sp. GW460P]MCC7706266.1 hypothetical protein [Janthinobacterium sp. GW460W]